jgi:3-phosphoshikimate 1-carboxyvinyltransferase
MKTTEMPLIALFYPQTPNNITVHLPSSKSESNRALLIDALYAHQTGKHLTLDNISTARDTVTMQRLLASKELELNVIDAGTTMRFLAAYCAVTNRVAVLTGTERMCERPISLLVDALRTLGADIAYLQADGFPPIHIKGFQPKQNAVTIRGDVSSQYISALLMIAPLLPQGLALTLTGTVQSLPYIQMTLNLLQHFGIQHTWQGQTIVVPSQTYQTAYYAVESDWSGASYWYSVLALGKKLETVHLVGLKENSLQGDNAIIKIMEDFGIHTQFDSKGAILTKKHAKNSLPAVIDFTHCPDLAQTLAVVVAAKGGGVRLEGLQSLRIKETDRIAALQNELAKVGVQATAEGDAALWIPQQAIQAPKTPIHTYKDHRMAMAFAPLSLLFPIQIEEPEVVVKSYPHFWSDFELLKGAEG